jgi:hypothetical protein
VFGKTSNELSRCLPAGGSGCHGAPFEGPVRSASLGVTALAAELSHVLNTPDFVCDHADCQAYGERIDEGDVDITFARASDLDAVRLR